MSFDSITKDPIEQVKFAAAFGSKEAFEELVKQGVSTNTPDEHGSLPLHHAVSGGHCDIAQILLTQHPETVNTANNYGQTPAHRALSTGHCVDLIVAQSGVDYNARDMFGESPANIIIKHHVQGGQVLGNYKVVIDDTGGNSQQNSTYSLELVENTYGY